MWRARNFVQKSNEKKTTILEKNIKLKIRHVNILQKKQRTSFEHAKLKRNRTLCSKKAFGCVVASVFYCHRRYQLFGKL